MKLPCLLDYIEHCGDTLTGQKRVYYEKTKDVILPSLLSCLVPGFVYLNVSDWMLKMLILKIMGSKSPKRWK